ncbi:zinc finger protein ZFAT-like isoform X1 [Channa argus]|uniref:zinc finger protein ZFAT-like isoform X1 n=1 Tax=Channa argus TaxID=215402 RepID=UPI003521D1C5
MDHQKTATSVFMCRLCNLFSPSRSLLLAHCSQLHPEQECSDDIIIALQPLEAEPEEILAENPVKRKRGRPKGSTKKMRTDVLERKSDSTCSLEVNVQREENGNKKNGDLKSGPVGCGENSNGTLGLECRDCHRSFSNRRQILKHICLKEFKEEEDEEENGRVCGGAGVEVTGSLDHGGADPNKTPQNQSRPGLMREKAMANFRPPRTNRNRISREGGPARGIKKSVISVVLTEDETLPGVSKMIPVEDNLTESVTIHAKTLSQELASDGISCEGSPKTDQGQSSNLTSTASAVISRGFQEYSIKQDATNLLQSQLKIFTCKTCNKIFKFRHSLIAHLRTHTQEKPFQCPHCNYASAIKANLNVHLRKHTGEKFTCQHCPFNCLSPGHLKVHIERVHLKVKQHCSFCEKKYSDVKNLLKHIEIRHNLKDPAVQQCYQQLRLKTRQGLRQLLYQCPTCNRRFKNQLQRERHLLIHGPQRPFACLLCDHAATKMTTLAAHLKKHFFIYICCVCDGKFVSSHRLKCHLKESHPCLDQEKTFTDCINSSYCLTQCGEGMWGNEKREDIEKRMDMQQMEQECEEMRRGEDRRNGVGGEEWQNGEGEQLEVAEREQDREEAKSQGGRAEVVQGIEGETGKEGETLIGDSQKGSQEVLQQLIYAETIASSDGQEEGKAGQKSQDKMANLCICAVEKICIQEENTHTSSSSERIDTPPLEDRTEENTHISDKNTRAAKNTHASSPANGHLSNLSVHTPLASAPAGEESHTPHPEKESEVFHQVFSSLQKSKLNMEAFQRLRKIYGDLECQYCGKLFWYKVHYNIHVRTHTKEHSHYCSKCSYSSVTKSSLKRHQIQKHSGLLLPCSHPGCKYTTPDKYKLQAHLRTHQGQDKTVNCPVCHQCYPEHRLKHHIRTSHPDTLPVRGKGLMVQRAEKCPYCESYFLKNSSDFQQHIWAHQGLKPYVCSVCDYAGRSRSNLKTHMNRHNTEKRHLCDLCGKKFKTKVTLKSHKLTHTNEGKPFQCSECDFTSVSKPYLLRHMEQHAEFKPFRCAHCHYSCNIAGPLKRHYNMKHPDQKYENAGSGLPNTDSLKQQGGMKCPECEFVYGTKWELSRHLKSKHSLKVVEGVWEVGEAVEAQYVAVEDEEQLTEAPVAALHDDCNNANVNIQHITELSSETHNAVTSVVAMAPGTVAVVQQVADEQEVGTCSNQLMVVNAEGDLTGDQVMVVQDVHGLEALTVLTQGENTHHYIVYVQEHTVEIN